MPVRTSSPFAARQFLVREPRPALSDPFETVRQAPGVDAVDSDTVSPALVLWRTAS